MADTLTASFEPQFEVLMQRHGGAGTAWRLGRIREDTLFSDTGRPIGPNVAKNESTPEAWRCEATAVIQRRSSFRRCFAPCIGHVPSGSSKVISGPPRLAITTPDDPLGWDAFGTGTFYRPECGLCGLVFRSCGADLERLGPTLGTTMLLAIAGRIVDMLRQLVEDDVLVTDFRLSNIVTQNPTMDDFRLWFVDTASIAIGQARPASSFVILAVHFRDQINALLPLAAALREFTAVHATLEPITSLRIPVGVAIALSAKISVAQLLRFSEASVQYFQEIDRICNTRLELADVCLANDPRPLLDFFHVFKPFKGVLTVLR